MLIIHVKIFVVVFKRLTATIWTSAWSVLSVQSSYYQESGEPVITACNAVAVRSCRRGHLSWEVWSAHTLFRCSLVPVSHAPEHEHCVRACYYSTEVRFKALI